MGCMLKRLWVQLEAQERSTKVDNNIVWSVGLLPPLNNDVLRCIAVWGYRNVDSLVDYSTLLYRIQRLYVTSARIIRNGKTVEVKPSLSRMSQWCAQKTFRILLQFCTHMLLLQWCIRIRTGKVISRKEMVCNKAYFRNELYSQYKTKSLEADRKKRKLLRLTAASKRRRRLASETQAINTTGVKFKVPDILVFLH